MRFVVYGVGAIGGTIAGKLAASGADVAGISRGNQLEALKKRGLLLETHEGDIETRFPVHGSPREMEFKRDDVILLCMKTQDTAAALEELRNAGVREQAVVCVQNAVENERLAMRLFPNVYGICVMLPAVYLEPGIVRCYAGPKVGMLDIGRMPNGTDKTCEAVSAALEEAGFVSRPDANIMRAKYGKLLMNFGNALQASLGGVSRSGRYYEALRSEGQAVLKAAGIAFEEVGADSARRGSLVQIVQVKGTPHPGGSSWQSLARGTGSIESDYLNGEIVLLGKQHGVPTPANAYFMTLAAEMARTKAAPGSVDPARVERELRL